MSDNNQSLQVQQSQLLTTCLNNQSEAFDIVTVHRMSDGLTVEKAMEDKPMMLLKIPKKDKLKAIVQLIAAHNSTLNDRITDYQVAEAAMIILDEFGDLSYDEIALALKWWKAGRIVIPFQGKMDSMKFVAVVRMYHNSDERIDFLESGRGKGATKKEVEKIEQDRESKEQLAKEYIPKILSQLKKPVQQPTVKNQEGTSYEDLISNTKGRIRHWLDVGNTRHAIALLVAASEVISSFDMEKVIDDYIGSLIENPKRRRDPDREGWDRIEFYIFDVVVLLSVASNHMIKAPLQEYIKLNVPGWQVPQQEQENI